jgi:DNA repair ATPase RecN
MTDLIPADSVYFERLSTVAEMTLNGHSVAEISREIGMNRKDTIAIQNEWKESMIADHEARDRALDALNVMDEHYNQLIKKSYQALEQIEDDLQLNGTTPQRIQQKLNALKLVADLEAKRLDALQKAGLLDAAEMGDHVADMEEKMGIMVSILRNDLCPECKRAVAQKLQQVTNQVEAVRVYE